MSLQFFGHPFSSYTQKVLIALWANETPFGYRLLEQDHPENSEELSRHSPYGLFPLIIDDGRPVFESTSISTPITLLRRLDRGDRCGPAQPGGISGAIAGASRHCPGRR
jgi:hypothetical protein